jgi:predicted DNA-binding transcriptional regulator YafY
MLATSDRLLRLLALLQSRPQWTGPELAERLGVTTRTVRNDVDRVRRLGYPVDAVPGRAGGYRLGAGAEMPPLLLDDREAVAIAVGLRLAEGAAIAGIDEASRGALAKLDQVLPSHLRDRVAAVDAATLTLAGARASDGDGAGTGTGDGPAVAPEVVAALAAACRDHRGLRFDYRDHDGAGSVRTVEPHRLVHARGRWYLVAWDADRAGWRTFRADRIALPANAVGERFVPREPPGGSFADHVTAGLAQAPWRWRARVTVHAPAERVIARLPAGAGAVEAIDERRCTYEAGSDTPADLAGWLALLGEDFEVEGPRELRTALATLADRLRRAADAGSTAAVSRPGGRPGRRPRR